MNLTDKHVVISGGGTGVGAAITHSFAAQGCKVTILGRTMETLQGVAEATGATPLICDVTNEQAMHDTIAEACANHGHVSIAIANAGAAPSKPFSRMRAGDLEDSLAVNLTGTFNLWRASLDGVKQAGWGRMIAIASTAGLRGYPYVSAYCASKHGVIGLTRALSLELAQTGVTVNAICPGFIETPLLERSIDNIVAKTGMTAEKAAATLRSVSPQNRFVQPEEVAETALWLCSDGAQSINGHTLSLSGGEV